MPVRGIGAYYGVAWVMGPAFALIAFVPQLLLAVAGGVAGQCVARAVRFLKARRMPEIA
jgi:hypothetical protein